MSDHLSLSRDDSDEDKVAALSSVVTTGDAVQVKVVEVVADVRSAIPRTHPFSAQHAIIFLASSSSISSSRPALLLLRLRGQCRSTLTRCPSLARLSCSTPLPSTFLPADSPRFVLWCPARLSVNLHRVHPAVDP